MLYVVAFILLALWLLGTVSTPTAVAFLYVFVLVGLVLTLLKLIGRRTLV